MNTASALSTVLSTQGVRGVAVFDAVGECVASDLPPPYEPTVIQEALRRVSAAADVFSSLADGDASAFAATCEGGTVIVRRAGEHTVLTLADATVNVNLLNVALNVLVLNLARASETSLAEVEVELSSVFGTESSRNFAAYSSRDAATAIPEDAVGRPALTRLLQVFTSYMGPAAKMVMKQHLAELGVSSRTLRQSQYEELLQRLAAKIPTPARQDAFLRAARAVGCS